MKKLLPFILVSVLVFSLIPSPVSASPGMDKPLPATNVHLGKKVTEHGKAPSGGSSVVRGAATGALGAPCGGNKYAIVIGISDYPGTANDLNYCDDDARDMITALTTLYGYDDRNITRLIDENQAPPPDTLNASFDNIRDAVLDIKKRANSEKDEVVFFFSGHGSYGNVAADNLDDAALGVDRDGIDEGILCHQGLQNGGFELIWDGQLREWFKGFATSRIIFVFDSCFSGGMTDLAATGRIINMACGETKLCAESWRWGGGNGQFTYYFADEGMTQGWADTYDHDKDGIMATKRSPGEPGDVVVEEAFDYAQRKCTGQNPVINDRFEKDLLL